MSGESKRDLGVDPAWRSPPIDALKELILLQESIVIQRATWQKNYEIGRHQFIEVS